jgi:hypothetical protein
MNDQIENLLRKAPQPKIPAHLQQKLQAGIVLPRVASDPGADAAPFFRRWFPALSFTMLFLASLIALAVQAGILSDLRRENQQLQLAAAEAAQLRSTAASLQSAEQLRLEQLRKDAEEVQRLRDEIAALSASSPELAALRAENQRLKSAVQTAQNNAPSGEEDPFAAAQERAKSIQCVSNLKQFGLGARIWANDHGNVLPPDVITMQNELNSPKILVCPSDTGKTRAASWAEFGPANLTYEYLAASVSETEFPHTVMSRCPVHNHVGFIDGSVHQGAWKRAVQKNGRWIVENNASRQ